MSGQLIFFVVVVSLFGGVALCGLAVFLYMFYRAIQRLTVVAEEVSKVIQPMAGRSLLPQMLKSFQSATVMSKEIVGGLAQITAVVNQFNKLFFAQNGGGKEPIAATAGAESRVDMTNQDSWFAAPTEPEQAHQEAVDEARKAGVPVDENDMGGEPPLSHMVGDQV